MSIDKGIIHGRLNRGPVRRKDALALLQHLLEPVVVGETTTLPGLHHTPDGRLDLRRPVVVDHLEHLLPVSTSTGTTS